MRLLPSALIAVIVAIITVYFTNYTTKNIEPNSQIIMDKRDVEDAIEDYIQKNPQKILEAVAHYQESKFKQMQVDLVEKNLIELRDESYPAAGNISRDSPAKVQIIEFFDYGCKYCKQMTESTEILVNEGKVKYIFRDLPIFGGHSLDAAKAALAVHFIDQNKYWPFHKALFSANTIDQEAIKQALKKVEVSEESYAQSLKNNADKIQEMLKKTESLASSLNVRGIPFIVIGNKSFASALDLNAMREAIKEAEMVNERPQQQ